jgi:hypothetical protein
MPDTDGWAPQYDRWRHGGWYVTNVVYPSGAVGCVSRNYPDRKWRIVCDNRPGSYPGGPNDHTYPSRDAAAYAERELARAEPMTVEHLLRRLRGRPGDQHVLLEVSYTDLEGQRDYRVGNVQELVEEHGSLVLKGADR